MIQENDKELKNKNSVSNHTGKKIINMFRKFIGTISWMTVIFLWISAGSVFVNPSQFRFLSILGLAFPFFLGAVIVSLLLCLVFARRKCWIPLLGLLGCCFSIHTYCPVNMSSAHPKDCLKIMSYNTSDFALWVGDSAAEELLDYVTTSQADIFCYQEGYCFSQNFFGEKILPALQNVWKYNDSININRNSLGCCSKYPILKKELLCSNDMNGATVFYLLLGENDTLRVINCHLQSMGLTGDDRKQYSQMVKHLNDSNAKDHSRLLISKISRATATRASQADSVANYIKRNAGKNIIVCGDFNDTPISYAFHRIASTGLTDVYGASGNGIGRSFNKDAIYVRIDHMFCSDHWEPYGCYIDKSISASDHYPIVAYLERVSR